MDIQVELEPDGYYHAVDRNAYDCDCDQDGFFSTSPVGFGKTPLDAIIDLFEEMDAS